MNVDPKILDAFARLYRTGRLAHAYLFVGPRETGKTETALAVAQLINCESTDLKPCQKCPPCQKILKSFHPDITMVNEFEGSIKIDQIRSMIARLQLKAFESKTKVVIIRNVELMTIEAANSLLKTLEEPSSNTLMILTTSIAEANLDTIRSRCHVVKFFPASRNRLQEVLGESKESAQFFAVYTDGCVGQARQMLENDFLKLKNQILDEFLQKAYDSSSKKTTDTEAEAQALAVLLSVVRDAMMLKAGAPADDLMHFDRLEDVARLAKRSSVELNAIYEQIIETKGLIDDHLNAKMALTLLRQRL